MRSFIRIYLNNLHFTNVELFLSQKLHAEQAAERLATRFGTSMVNPEGSSLNKFVKFRFIVHYTSIILLCLLYAPINCFN